MKKLIYVFLIGFISSCNGGEESEDNTDTTSNLDTNIILVDTANINYTEELDTVPNNEIKEIKIEDLPTKWLRLSENVNVPESGHNDGYCIYHMCFMELPQIWIEYEEDKDWYLTVIYGQDSERWVITGFEAAEAEHELYLVVNGTFNLEPDNNYGESKTVTFWWNKDIAFASFVGLYDFPVDYVPENDKDVYEEYTEDCEDELDGH